MEENKNLTVIGSKEVNPTEPTNEREEKVNEFIRQRALQSIVHPFRSPLKKINEELEKGRTIDELVKEVMEKRSKFPRRVRDVLTTFNEDGVKRMLAFMKEGNGNNLLENLRKKNDTDNTTNV